MSESVLLGRMSCSFYREKRFFKGDILGTSGIASLQNVSFAFSMVSVIIVILFLSHGFYENVV